MSKKYSPTLSNCIYVFFKISIFLLTIVANWCGSAFIFKILVPDAQPTDSERETFEEVQQVLKNSESILDEIQCYKGAGREIREAIANSAEEFQTKAWTAVVPLVLKLKRFYEFSLELGKSWVCRGRLL